MRGLNELKSFDPQSETNLIWGQEPVVSNVAVGYFFSFLFFSFTVPKQTKLQGCLTVFFLALSLRAAVLVTIIYSRQFKITLEIPE